MDKARIVQTVFERVAPYYDRMNDVLSLGLHRIWKKVAVSKLRLQPHHEVLDLACGSGDMAALVAPYLRHRHQLTLADPSWPMLEKSQALTDEGWVGMHRIACVAEALPFKNERFDRIIMSFGLRNTSNMDAALFELHRVLRRGGRLVILEFSKPEEGVMLACYQFYLHQVVPRLGALFAEDKASYDYLAASIAAHPSQTVLLGQMEALGLKGYFQNLHGGIVAIHVGFKV